MLPERISSLNSRLQLRLQGLILVHMYTDIDVERVYGYLQKNLDDVKLFGRLVAL